MKVFKLEDYLLDEAAPAYVAVPSEKERWFKDAVAYVSFIADEYDAALLPKQISAILETVYGIAPAPPPATDVMDISMERKLYHVRGRPLPMKVALMTNKDMAKDSLRSMIERFAAENEAA
jgi:hypothetical protein